jgi:hypothetical protein
MDKPKSGQRKGRIAASFSIFQMMPGKDDMHHEPLKLCSLACYQARFYRRVISQHFVEANNNLLRAPRNCSPVHAFEQIL